ncbi:MAG: DNA circularization N-terminal domain-containing protein [Bacteroidia bacterium]|nr:DNA circularization N-terminal domain-containing protein [Bacteroidia bacterium]
MPIEIGGISLSRIHRIHTLERADFVRHRVPGLEGDLVQNMGRASVRLQIEGAFFGETALDDLNALRDIYKAREPIDFLADITGSAYFAQVIIEQFEVSQLAGEVDQFNIALVVAEYVEPPEANNDLGLDEVDAGLELEALDFMDMIELPDLLSVPGFGDPTPPLSAVLDGIKASISKLTDSASVLSDLFGDD